MHNTLVVPLAIYVCIICKKVISLSHASNIDIMFATTMDDAVVWFQALPPITRTWLGAAIAVNAAATLDLLHPSQVRMKSMFPNQES